MPRRKNLYHGTLLRNLPLIEEQGLVPRIGTFTKEFYGDAKGVVPAIFMADLKGLDRVVHAMVAGIMDEVTEEDFETYDIGPHYHLNDELFYKYGVIFVVERDSSITLVGHSNADEPTQAEAGDWYALEVVRPTKAITGDDLCNFLAERDLTPSSINDFVDPFSVRSGTRIPAEPPISLLR